MPIRRPCFLAVALVTSVCMAKASATPVDLIHHVAVGEPPTAQYAAAEATTPPDPAQRPPARAAALPDPRESLETSSGGGLAAAIPEPGIAALMALGFAGIGWITRRRTRENAASPPPLDESGEQSRADGTMKNAAVRGAGDRPN